VVGTSVSGEVSRTAEALRYARIAGAKTLAFTAAPASPVAQAAEIVVDSSQPAFDVPAGLIVPGIRSFTANQIAALLLALQIGKIRGRLTPDQYQKRKAELFALGAAADRCISRNLEKIETLAGDWLDERDSIFCGSGPNFGSALFSAAKMIEATGEMSAGQDLEEWAHLQYFSKHATTPTFILSAADRDKTRAKEIITAAIAIGRRVAVIAPEDAAPGNQAGTVHLSISAGFSEMFTPILMVIPGALYAAWRAEKLGEPYFRDFSGGRSREGGGGISRIRTSESPTDFFTAHKEF
jgi:glucosamine--fructose-6-phosphate aminotransferase (isomerizing)